MAFATASTQLAQLLQKWGTLTSQLQERLGPIVENLRPIWSDPLWQFIGLIAAGVLALVLGVWLLRKSGGLLVAIIGPLWSWLTAPLVSVYRMIDGQIAALRDRRAAQAEAGNTGWRLLNWISFREGIDAVRYLVTRRNWRYHTSWYLLTGAEGSGKSRWVKSIRKGARTQLLASEKQLVSAGSNWHFFDLGLIIDVEHEQSFARTVELLTWYRPERPLDGVILAISAADLLQAEDKNQLRTLGQTLYQQLWEVQKRTGFVVPVYVIVTQCEAVDGFESFWAAQEEKHLGEMFGWSNPSRLDIAYSPAWVGDAVDSVIAGVRAAQLEVTGSGREIADVDAFMLFDREFLELESPLSEVMEAAFARSSFRESLPLRGIWFSGSVNETDVLSEEFASHKLWPETYLAFPVEQRRFSSSRILRRFQHASLIVAGLLVVALAVDTMQLYQYRLRAEKSLREIEQLTPHQGSAVSCREQDSTIWRVLGGLTDISQQPKTPAMPASWGGGYMPTLTEYVAERVYPDYIFPVLKCRLVELKATLYGELNNSPQAGATELSGSIAASTGESSRRKLEQFASQLLHYQRSVAGFRRLAESPDRVVDVGDVFKRLLNDLYDTPIPAGINFKKGELIAAALTRVSIEIEASWIATNELPDEAFEKLGYLAERARARLQEVAETAPVEPIERAIQSGGDVSPSVQRFKNWMAYVQKAWLDTDSNNSPCGMLNKHLSQLQSLDSREGFQLKMRDQVLAQFSPELCDEPVRQALLDLQVAPLGKLFDGDTTSTLAFSSQLSNWNQQLSQLISLNLLSLATTTNSDPVAGDVVRWNAASLDTAVGYLMAFQDFRQRWWTQATEPFYAPELRRRLALNTQQLIMQAQIKQVSVPPRALSSVVDPEAELRARIQSFGSADGLILQLLSLLRQQGDNGNAVSLIRAGDEFVQQQLSALKSLTNNNRLYQPAQSPQWASVNFAAAMFSYSEPAELKSYLQNQRQRVGYLAQNYALPLVSYLLDSGGIAATETDAKWWFDTLLALRQYQRQQPGNNVAQLEQFVGTQMASLNSSRCNDWLAQPAFIYSAGGLFAQRHQQLDMQIRSHCKYYGKRSVAESYQALAMSFNQQLAGRFPFAAADKAGSNDLEATAIQHFFTGFRQQWFDPDQGKDLLKDLKALAVAQPGLSLTDAINFVEKLTRLSRFWEAASGAREALNVPLAVEFAALPQKSVGLDQIIEWQFESGSSRLVYPNGGTRAKWQPGDTLNLSLRWATGSNYVPISSTESPAQINQTSKSAVFLSKGRWGLFEWLGAFGGDTNNGALLSFDVPVRVLAASAKPSQDSTATSAATVTSRVNLRLMFVNPVDGAKPYIPAPPVPPVYAPELPATGAGKTGGSYAITTR